MVRSGGVWWGPVRSGRARCGEVWRGEDFLI